VATIPQYVTIMRNTAWDIARRFGVDLQYEAKSDLDVLVKKGVVTDAEMLTAINAVRSSPWQPGHLSERPVEWDTDPVTGV
jgi:hypothetical protein